MTPLLLGVVVSLGLGATPPTAPGRYFTAAHLALCEKAADVSESLGLALVPARLSVLGTESAKGRRGGGGSKGPRAEFLLACSAAPHDLVTCLAKAGTAEMWGECGRVVEADCDALLTRPEVMIAVGGTSEDAARTRCAQLPVEHRACLRAARSADAATDCDPSVECDEAIAVVAEVIGADETIPEKTRRHVMLTLTAEKTQRAEADACRRLPSGLRSCLLAADDGRGLDACARGDVFDLDRHLAGLDPFSRVIGAMCEAAEQNARALEVAELTTLNGCRAHAYETIECIARASDADTMPGCVRQRRERCEVVLTRLLSLVEGNDAMPARDRRALLDALRSQSSAVIDECVREPEPVVKCLAGDGETPVSGLDLLPRIASCPERVSCDRAFHNLRALIVKEIPRRFHPKAFEVLERPALTQSCRAVPEAVRRCVESAASLVESAACGAPPRGRQNSSWPPPASF